MIHFINSRRIDENLIKSYIREISQNFSNFRHRFSCSDLVNTAYTWTPIDALRHPEQPQSKLLNLYLDYAVAQCNIEKVKLKTLEIVVEEFYPGDNDTNFYTQEESYLTWVVGTYREKEPRLSNKVYTGSQREKIRGNSVERHLLNPTRAEYRITAKLYVA